MSDSIYAQPHVRGKPPPSATDVWICVAALTLTVPVLCAGIVGYIVATGMANAPSR